MQNDFYDLLDKYNKGLEPLENWITADLVKLIDAADTELQNRAPPDGTRFDLPTDSFVPKGTIESDDNY